MYPTAPKSRCQCKSRHMLIGSGFLFLLGLAFILVAALAPPYIRQRIDSGIRDATIVDSSNAQGYDTWASSDDKDAPFIRFDLYLFNVTNPEEVEQGEQPNLVEIGPIQTRFNYRRYNATWVDNGDVVRYMLWQYYVPILDDPYTAQWIDQNITSLYMPYQVTQGFAELARFAMCSNDNNKTEFLKAEKTLFTSSHTIRELVFGYADPFLGYFPGLLNNYTKEQNTALGYYIEEYTGKINKNLARSYRVWQSSSAIQCAAREGSIVNPTANPTIISAWDGIDANLVKGSFGDQFASEFDPGSSIPVFEDTLYRHFTMENMNLETEEVDGIKLYNFRLPTSELANATNTPSNAAYYAYGPNGLLNMSRCANSMPIFFSKPYFLNGDSSLRTRIGFSSKEPSVAKYDTFIGVEPYTGTSMNVAERLQLNVRLSPGTCTSCGFDPNYPCFPNLPKDGLYLPVMWIDKWGKIPHHLAKEFKHEVYHNLHIANGIEDGGFAAGGVLIFASVLGIFFGVRRRSRERLVDHSSYMDEKDMYHPFDDGI